LKDLRCLTGDISVDIEPIHRTTGHKSAAFVGGFNTIGAPTRMTWSGNAGLSKFSSKLINSLLCTSPLQVAALLIAIKLHPSFELESTASF
jgi:hypothetical protein